MFEIVDTIDLTGMGYDKGSEAVVNINFTRAWHLAWAESIQLEQGKDETLTAYMGRKNAPKYALAAQMIKRITLIQGDTRYDEIVTPDVIATVDGEIDTDLLNFILDEAQERGDARVVNAATTFREQRLRALQGRQKNKDKAAKASDKPTSDGADAEQGASG